MQTPVEWSAIGPAVIMTGLCVFAYIATGLIRDVETRRTWRTASLTLTLVWVSVLVIVVVLGLVAWSVQNSI